MAYFGLVTATVYNDALTSLGSTTAVLKANASYRLNQIGRMSCEIMVADPDSDLFVANRIVNIKQQNDGSGAPGSFLGFGSFIIHRRDEVVRGDGISVISLSGPEFTYELTYRETGRDNVIYDSGTDSPGDLEQVSAYDPAWSIGGATNTTYATYLVTANESVFKLLQQLADQTGHRFYNNAPLIPTRQILWAGGGLAGSPALTLALRTPTEVIDSSTGKGAIKDLTREIYSDEIVTRVRVEGAGLGGDTLKLADAETLVTVPSGYSVTWASSVIVNTALEASGQRVIEQVKQFPNIRPIDDTTANKEKAAVALFNAAINWLQDRAQTSEILRVKALQHKNIYPGDRVDVVYSETIDSNTQIDINGQYVVHEVAYNYSVDGGGVTFTDFVLGSALQPRPLGMAKIAELIDKSDTLTNHTDNPASGSPPGSGGGDPTDHGTLDGLADDDHVMYLRADGGRQLVGNLTVAAGITLDGVDLSAHAIDPDAHHDAVDAAQGIQITGTQTVGILLASPSGLDFSSGGLQIAQGVAGNGLTMSALDKILHVGVGAGLSATADQIDLALSPDTLTVSTTNTASGADHAHAITTSSNPGAAASILATDASGKLQLEYAGINVTPGSSDNRLTINGDLRFIGSRKIHSTTDGYNLTLAPNGDLILDPTGNDVLPFANYDIIFGAPLKKYLKLYVAELEADQLVAQDVIATIGGRIIVAPTTVITSPVGASDGFIIVKHNEPIRNDTLWLEARLQFEMMLVVGYQIVGGVINTSVYISGDHTSEITSSLTLRIEDSSLDAYDGTYTVNSVTYNSGSGQTEIGLDSFTGNPTAGGYILAIEQSDGSYDYPVTRDRDGSGANSWIEGDAVINTGIAGDGWIDLYALGGLGTAGPTIAGVVRQSTTYNDFAPSWAIGNLNGLYGYSGDTPGVGLGQYVSGDTHITIDSNNGIRFFDGLTTVVGQWQPGGDIQIGEVATNKANILWDQSAGRINFRGGTGGTVVSVYIDTDGSVVAGSGVAILDDEGLTVANSTSDAWNRARGLKIYDSTAAEDIFRIWSWVDTTGSDLTQGFIYISSANGLRSTGIEMGVRDDDTEHYMILDAEDQISLSSALVDLSGQTTELDMGGFGYITFGPNSSKVVTVGTDTSAGGEGIQIVADNIGGTWGDSETILEVINDASEIVFAIKHDKGERGYIFYPLTTHDYAWTSLSRTGGTVYTLNLSSFTYVPTDAVALSIQITINCTLNGRVRAGANSTDPKEVDLQADGTVGNWHRVQGITRTDQTNDCIYFKTDTTGDVWLSCNGFWV